MSGPREKTPAFRVLIAAASVGILFGVVGTVLGVVALTRGPEQAKQAARSHVSSNGSTTSVHTVTVPDVIDQTTPKAEAELQSIGLNVTVSTTSSPSSANVGLIVAQQPVGGSKVVPGHVIWISVSSR